MATTAELTSNNNKKQKTTQKNTQKKHTHTQKKKKKKKKKKKIENRKLKIGLHAPWRRHCSLFNVWKCKNYAKFIDP